jgi:transposase
VVWEEWKMVEQQIGCLSHELERIADADAVCSRIQLIPGIGPVDATAIVAAIGKRGCLPYRPELYSVARACSQGTIHESKVRQWRGKRRLHRF